MPARPLLLLLATLLLTPLTAAARADDAHAPRRACVVRAHRGGAHVHVRGRCRYTRGHYATRARRVVVPGHHVRRVVPAEYAVRWSRAEGAYVTVCVRPRSTVRVWVPERIEVRRRRVWVPGTWRCR